MKHGEVAWSEPVGEPKANKKDRFLRLGNGSNIVRVLTLPYLYNQHKFTPPGGKKFGYRVACAGKDNGCSLCQKEEPKKRFYLGVIDRVTNSYKILDIPGSVHKAIKTLANDEDWGPPTNYDIDIVVDPKGGSTGYYTVVAKPPKPLSATDLLIKDDVDVEDLKRMSNTPPLEKVEERISNILAEISAQGGSNSSGEDSDEDSDADNFFKNVK